METHETTAVVEHEPAPSGGLFSFEPGLAIWTWVVFALLFIVLRKYAWGPMMQSVREREQTLADAVENARKTREALVAIAERQKQMIQEAEDRVRTMIDEGRQSAEAAARVMTERAQQEADKTLAQAKQQIEREKEKALEELKTEAVDMVIATAGKLVNEGLDDDQHRRIVERHLEQL